MNVKKRKKKKKKNRHAHSVAGVLKCRHRCFSFHSYHNITEKTVNSYNLISYDFHTSSKNNFEIKQIDAKAQGYTDN